MNLLEVLITLSLIAILSSLTVNSYQCLIATERRHEARQALLQLAAALEDYAFIYHGYQDVSLDKLNMAANIANNNYRLHIDSSTDNTYQISARPGTAQRKLDMTCQTLILHADGLKEISGNGTIQECW